MGNDIFGECCKEESEKSDSTESEEETTKPKQLFKDSSTLPLTQIDLKFKPTISSLSSIPIGTKNVIRKLSGSPFDSYQVIDVLGNGSYGKVYKVQQRTTGQLRAMKIISKALMKNKLTEDEIENEINILKNVCHPNIIKLFEVYNEENSYYLINEFCSEGDLCKYLVDNGKLPENIVKPIMYQIFSAISYLHSNMIIHGDIKLENIMIDSNTNEKAKITFQNALNDSISHDICNHNDKSSFHILDNFNIKIIDFGCGKIFSKPKQKFNGKTGTLFYSSPEVLKNNYNSACDIWACGVLMYILLGGELPFQGATESEINEKIIKGRYCFYNRLFYNISFEAKDLMRKCFVYNPSDRITAQEALKHPFFTNYKERKKSVDNYHNSNTYIQKTKEVISSLVSFTYKSKFFQAVLTYLTHNFMQKQEINDIKDIFLSIDTDLDGKISKSELRECLIKIGMKVSEDELSQIMKRVDFDNDGFIDYQEFLQASTSQKDLFTDENLKSAFNLFDTHSDGTVSVRELEEILGLSGEIDKGIIKELLRDINKTEDDEFTFSEFKSMIMHYSEQKCEFECNNTTHNTSAQTRISVSSSKDES
jgi:calcium-dependent protein kinase